MANNISVLDSTDTTQVTKTIQDNDGVHLPARAVYASDSMMFDAFGRLRTSNPEATLFSSHFRYGRYTLQFNESTTGDGAIAHNADEGCMDLTNDLNGDDATLQSKKYAHYQPGHSQFILITAAYSVRSTNSIARIGYFDDDNGHFFKLQSNNISVVERSSVTGAAVDTEVTQANWNVDTLDGNGPSGVNLDLTASPGKTVIYWIDLEALYVGRVRMGVVIAGKYYQCHEFLHSNVFTTPYIQNASLPIRWQLNSTGVPGGTTKLKAICAAVVSEGGQTRTNGFQFTALTAVAGVGVTTRRPILSIQPHLLFNGIVNRVDFDIADIPVMARSNECICEIVYNGTLTGASFADVDTNNSAMRYDTSATAISGGIVVDSFPVPSGSGSGSNAAISGSIGKFPLSLDIGGANPTPLSVVVTSVSGTSIVNSSITWRELH